MSPCSFAYYCEGCHHWTSLHGHYTQRPIGLGARGQRFFAVCCSRCGRVQLQSEANPLHFDPDEMPYRPTRTEYLVTYVCSDCMRNIDVITAQLIGVSESDVAANADGWVIEFRCPCGGNSPLVRAEVLHILPG